MRLQYALAESRLSVPPDERLVVWFATEIRRLDALLKHYRVKGVNTSSQGGGKGQVSYYSSGDAPRLL